MSNNCFVVDFISTPQSFHSHLLGDAAEVHLCILLETEEEPPSAKSVDDTLSTVPVDTILTGKTIPTCVS